MAVYTDVSDEELAAFIGRLRSRRAVLSVKGIAEGVENSNYLVAHRAGQFILTLYEKRVAPPGPALLPRPDGASSPRRGINCPLPVQRPVRDATLGTTRRPAGRDHHVSRRPVGARGPRPSTARGSARRSRRLHLAGRRYFRSLRRNALSRRRAGGRSSSDRATRADRVQRRGLLARRSRELEHLERNWPRDLPEGVIHADLFPDNVFFLGERALRPDRLLLRLQRHARL